MDAILFAKHSALDSFYQVAVENGRLGLPRGAGAAPGGSRVAWLFGRVAPAPVAGEHGRAVVVHAMYEPPQSTDPRTGSFRVEPDPAGEAACGAVARAAGLALVGWVFTRPPKMDPLLSPQQLVAAAQLQARAAAVAAAGGGGGGAAAALGGDFVTVIARKRDAVGFQERALRALEASLGPRPAAGPGSDALAAARGEDWARAVEALGRLPLGHPVHSAAFRECRGAQLASGCGVAGCGATFKGFGREGDAAAQAARRAHVEAAHGGGGARPLLWCDVAGCGFGFTGEDDFWDHKRGPLHAINDSNAVMATDRFLAVARDGLLRVPEVADECVTLRDEAGKGEPPIASFGGVLGKDGKLLKEIKGFGHKPPQFPVRFEGPRGGRPALFLAQ